MTIKARNGLSQNGYGCVCVCACVRVRVRVFVRACACVFVFVCVFAEMLENIGCFSTLRSQRFPTVPYPAVPFPTVPYDSLRFPTVARGPPGGSLGLPGLSWPFLGTPREMSHGEAVVAVVKPGPGACDPKPGTWGQQLRGPRTRDHGPGFGFHRPGPKAPGPEPKARDPGPGARAQSPRPKAPGHLSLTLVFGDPCWSQNPKPRHPTPGPVVQASGPSLGLRTPGPGPRTMGSEPQTPDPTTAATYLRKAGGTRASRIEYFLLSIFRNFRN